MSALIKYTLWPNSLMWCFSKWLPLSWKHTIVQDYNFASLELTGPNLFHQDNAGVNKMKSIKTWCATVGVVELEWPAESSDKNSTEHLWDKPEC